jgi:DNA repair protein RecO (recombination protein O)
LITKTAKTLVLSRTNYGEADKIATLLTEQGDKISVIVKGVRKPKSKLVTAAELFTISKVTYIEGKSKTYTITSAKLIRQHTNFLKDYEKVQLAYKLIKLINKYSEPTAGPEYFEYLAQAYNYLEQETDINIVELWAMLRVLSMSGHGLELSRQVNGKDFVNTAKYNFDIERSGFYADENGYYTAEHIKFLKLANLHSIDVLFRVKNGVSLSNNLNPLVKQFVETHLKQI